MQSDFVEVVRVLLSDSVPALISPFLCVATSSRG